MCGCVWTVSIMCGRVCVLQAHESIEHKQRPGELSAVLVSQDVLDSVADDAHSNGHVAELQDIFDNPHVQVAHTIPLVVYWVLWSICWFTNYTDNNYRLFCAAMPTLKVRIQEHQRKPS